MWCNGPCPGDPDPSPSAGGTASFSQTATFIGGVGNGTLVFVNISGYALQSGGFYAGQAYFQGVQLFSPFSWYMIEIPIVFGTPVTISGSVSGYASDNDISSPYPAAELDVGGFRVLNANRGTVGMFSGLANYDTAIYSLQTGAVTSPEAVQTWIVGIALILFGIRAVTPTPENISTQ
jgi:hypothetical protein